jgi:hypothetical protein
MRTRRRALVLLLAIAAGAVRCTGDGPAEPPAAVPGTRMLQVDSPNGAEGAALIELDATNVHAVGGDSAMVLVERDGAKLRVAIVRATPGLLRLRVDIADTAAAVTATLLEVAGPQNALRPLTGYSVSVAR